MITDDRENDFNIDPNVDAACRNIIRGLEQSQDSRNSPESQPSPGRGQLIGARSNAAPIEQFSAEKNVSIHNDVDSDDAEPVEESRSKDRHGSVSSSKASSISSRRGSESDVDEDDADPIAMEFTEVPSTDYPEEQDFPMSEAVHEVSSRLALV